MSAAPCMPPPWMSRWPWDLVVQHRTISVAEMLLLIKRSSCISTARPRATAALLSQVTSECRKIGISFIKTVASTSLTLSEVLFYCCNMA